MVSIQHYSYGDVSIIREDQGSRTYDCITKDGPSRVSSNADQRDGGDERATKAYEAVYPEVFAESGWVRVEEENKVYVDCHGERPPWVRLHEPFEQ